jgi:hypothetical protein
MAISSAPFTPESLPSPDDVYFAEVRAFRVARQLVTEEQVATLDMVANAYIDSQVGCPRPGMVWNFIGAAERDIAKDCVHTGNHRSADARARYITKLHRINMKTHFEEKLYKGE